MNKIKEFVRQTLGCECPDQVFEYIDLKRDIKLEKDLILKYKINIGNRLLIYAFEIIDISFLNINLSTLIHVGKSERDKKGFNRFRLVIVTDDKNNVERSAEKLFKVISDVDDKIHLHIIDKGEFPVL